MHTHTHTQTHVHVYLQDGNAMLWDLNEGKHLYTLNGGEVINALVFGPNRYCHWTVSKDMGESTQHLNIYKIILPVALSLSLPRLLFVCFLSHRT